MQNLNAMESTDPVSGRWLAQGWREGQVYPSPADFQDFQTMYRVTLKVEEFGDLANEAMKVTLGVGAPSANLGRVVLIGATIYEELPNRD